MRKTPGTWEKRGIDSYRLWVFIGMDFKGKEIRPSKTVHCKSDKEADKALALFYADCMAGNYKTGSVLTIEKFSKMFIEDYCRKVLKIRSIARYETYIKNQIDPLLGSKQLSKLTPLAVQQWVNHISDHLSPKTVRGAFSVLRMYYTVAQEWGLVNFNPCMATRLPPQSKEDADFYNKDEVTLLLDKLLEGMESERQYCTGIILCLFTGLRLAELNGLRWSDIDFKAARMSVVRQRAYVWNVGIVEDTPKTKKSKRIISVPGFCLELLMDLKADQDKQKVLLQDKWIDSGYILITSWGEPNFPRNISRWFSDFLAANELRRITFHQLRHTHASMLVYLNKNLFEIGERLGHTKEATTLRYGHMFVDSDADTSEKLETFYQSIR